MNEQRQNEIKALLHKHHTAESEKRNTNLGKEISLANINGSYNNFYINSYTEDARPKKN